MSLLLHLPPFAAEAQKRHFQVRLLPEGIRVFRANRAGKLVSSFISYTVFEHSTANPGLAALEEIDRQLADLSL